MKIINRFFLFFKIDYDKLSKSHTSGLLFLDLFMILLILFNLSWIIFEYSFTFDSFRSFLTWAAPAFSEWYGREIHPYFFYYDLIFVAIFVLELTVRWVLAIFRKTYAKWFFYPFVHWYDVLGCIPLSSFRALRLLRVFSMFYRLNRLGIIDMRSTYLFKQGNKYLGILTEEISDRVVVNVLSGMQDEVKKGTPIADKIVREVLLPKQHIISTWMAKRIGVITISIFEKNEAVFRKIIDDALSKALRNNKDIARLKMIPGAGALITNVINESVSDITFNSIKESIYQFSNPENNAGMVNDASRLVLETLIESHEGDDHSLDELVSQITADVIEVIKDEVKVQQWKIKEDKQKAEKAERKAQRKIQ
ncbi:MAG: hypothetical protein R2730_07845 [Chitinophagales bacterium]